MSDEAHQTKVVVHYSTAYIYETGSSFKKCIADS